MNRNLIVPTYNCALFSIHALPFLKDVGKLQTFLESVFATTSQRYILELLPPSNSFHDRKVMDAVGL